MPSVVSSSSRVAKLPRVTTTAGCDELELGLEVGTARRRSRRGGGRGCRGAGTSRRWRCSTGSARGRSPGAGACRAACPDRPTKGSPARSSSRPGPSPTNMSDGVGVADAEDDLGPARGQRAAGAGRRPRSASSARVPTAAWYRRRPGPSGASADLGGELLDQAGELVTALEHGHVPAAGQLDQLGVGQRGGGAQGVAGRR